MSLEVERLHQKLVSHITQQDQKEEKRARAKGRHFSIYALGIMLRAAQEAEEEAKAAGGSQRDWLLAVMSHFTATRPMHTFLKKIDPSVEVVRGRWVYEGR